MGFEPSMSVMTVWLTVIIMGLTAIGLNWMWHRSLQTRLERCEDRIGNAEKMIARLDERTSQRMGRVEELHVTFYAE